MVFVENQALIASESKLEHNAYDIHIFWNVQITWIELILSLKSLDIKVTCFWEKF